MKHYIITSDPTTPRCKRAIASMNNDVSIKLYDPNKQWPLRGFTRKVNEILADNPNEPVCICNDDVVFENFARWNERAQKAIDDGAGIVCPVQVDSKNPHSVIMGGTVQAFPSGVHHLGTREMHCRDEYSPAKWLPFCVVAIANKAVKTVGMLDEQMAMWFSDSDYCLRMRLSGFGVVLDRGTVILHDNHATVGDIARGTPNATRFHADMEAFRRKWSGDQLADMS